MRAVFPKCGHSFETREDSLPFFERIALLFDKNYYEIPAPTLCPMCRQQRRLAWRNERYLYRRKSSLSGAPLVSIYSPDKPYSVYGQNEFYSDKWDPLSYGRDFDFSRSFFEQFEDLLLAVPRLSLVNRYSENSEFNNWVIYLKNCYLLTGSRDDEDCYYSHWLWRSRDCVDCSYVFDSELCYACTDCANCYDLFFSQDCVNCRDSLFLQHCSNCADCFGCVELHHKQFCFFNEQLSEQEYCKRLEEHTPLTPRAIEQFTERIALLNSDLPHKHYHGRSIEASVGDYLENCKNCQFCYDIQQSEDCFYSDNVMRSNDMVDCSRAAHSELCYESLSPTNSTRGLFSVMCWYCNSVLYSDTCTNSSNIFGSVSLDRKEYCVLNKPYAKAEYEALVPRIIEHMQDTGEWGEFFPIELSPFGYNETVANEYFPLSEEDVRTKNYKWNPSPYSLSKTTKTIDAHSLPADISQASDELVGYAICCEDTGKPFGIIAQELEYHRQNRLPLPRKHPTERHRLRIARRNPRTLWRRKCSSCSKAVQTTYSADEQTIIYCEECYLQAVR